MFSKEHPFTDLLGDNIVKVYSLWQIGDIIRKRTGERADYNRVSIDVSEAEWDEYDRQVLDAIGFLKTHKKYMKNIMKMNVLLVSVTDNFTHI
jgi:hypothetical protein